MMESKIQDLDDLDSHEVAATSQNALQVQQSAGQSLDQSLTKALTSIAGLSPQDGVKVAPIVVINNRQGDVIHTANVISGASKFTVDQSRMSVGDSKKIVKKSSNDKIAENSQIFPEPKDLRKINAVMNKRINGIFVDIKDDAMTCNCYKVILHPLASRTEKTTIESDQCSITISDLTPGEEYRISVFTQTAGGQKKEIFSKGTVQMLPDEVCGISSRYLPENNSVLYKWDPLEIKPDHYLVESKVDVQAIQKVTVEDTKFEIHNVRPGCSYDMRVTAVNSAGPGRASQWQSFFTAPPPPKNIVASENPIAPTDSIIVNFDSVDIPNVKYRVEAISYYGSAITEVTEKNTVTLGGLNPGTSYYISVVTLYRGKESKKGFQA